ncbi:MAG: Serine/threonine protein kinase PrkC, regulator of stationary phase [Myxococcaceae bacterium]|nr:Serine/threonine protein kinase PrkC, regulator of stationary phase [Myxococcaceae bacterium]
MEESRSPAPHKRATAQGPDPLIGRVINERYRVVGTIARGGMGKVYRAEQQPLGRLVALKVLSPNYTGENDPEFHRRFFLEASIASKLSHPNTVTIFDYGKTDDDVYYIAMELLEGRTLHRVLRDEAPLSAERTMHIGRQICRSLREAHNAGVIHRDLKPANVFLLNHGDESDVVKVLDFGLVKNLLDKGEELTQTGLFMGSPKYMSPEQIRGDACDGRVDIYALGVMMYEMLTGKVPFDRQNSVNILMAHIHEDVPRIQVMNPNALVPAALENVVRKCMSKSVEGRYPTMEAVLSALKQVSGVHATMTGEFRAPNFADLSRSIELPLPTQVSSRGDLLSGGHKPSVTEIDARTMGTLNGFGTPANGQTFVTPAHGQSFGTPVHGQTLVDTSMVAQPVLSSPTSRRSQAPRKQTWLVASACAVLVLGSGALFLSGRSDARSAAQADKAAQATAAAEVRPAARTTPLAEPTNSVPAQTSVLVSLRSTPAGAMVLVGAKEYGPTPTQVEWTGEEASIGREVTLRFQRHGFRDVTVTRQIRGPQLEIDAPPMDPAVAESAAPAPVRAPPGPRPAPVARPAPRVTPASAAPVTPPSPAASAAHAATPKPPPPEILRTYKAEPY